MKVWYAADIPSIRSGGIACSMRELSKGLNKNGHEVQVITREELPSKNYLVFAFRLLIYFLLSGSQRPDWIIARSTDAVFCALIVRFFKLNVGLILYNHGWEEIVYKIESRLPSDMVSNPTTWRATLIRFPLLRLMLNLCSFCISGTEHENMSIGEKYPRSKGKLIYLPNGISVPTGLPQNGDKYPLRFITVGNATWKKNLVHTVQVFSFIKNHYPDAHLLCVGTGLDDRSFTKYCSGKVDGVTNVPSVNYSEMRELYSKYPYMIASSRYEGGHSFAILEAFSYGIVVFASDIQSNREIISDTVNGFIIGGTNVNVDAENIIEKINAGIDEESIKRNAIKALGQYTWERQVQKLEHLLCGIHQE